MFQGKKIGDWIVDTMVHGLNLLEILSSAGLDGNWKGRIGFALGLEGVRQYLNWNWKGGIGGLNKCMTGWRPKRPRMP